MQIPARFRPWFTGALAVLCGGLALRFVVPLLLPFVVGVGIALLVERPVEALTARGIRRGAASVICVGGLLLLLGAGIWLLLRRGAYEMEQLWVTLPELLHSLALPMAQLRGRLIELAARAPDGLGTALREAVDRLFASAPAMLARLSEWALGWGTDLVAALPGLLLGTVTALVSAFLISAEWPELRRAGFRLLPKPWQERVRRLVKRLHAAFGGWLRAEVQLMGITFALVTVGLLLIGVRYALLAGALIALVDALPVFGVGTVLLPWALLFFLRGNSRCGFALVALYAVAALTRTALEPRLVGRHLGASPLLTLVAMYLGYRLLGLWGMVLSPLAAVLISQLLRGNPTLGLDK